MNTPNEIELIGEINILEKQNEDTTKKLNKKSYFATKSQNKK